MVIGYFYTQITLFGQNNKCRKPGVSELPPIPTMVFIYFLPSHPTFPSLPLPPFLCSMYAARLAQGWGAAPDFGAPSLGGHTESDTASITFWVEITQKGKKAMVIPLHLCIFI